MEIPMPEVGKGMFHSALQLYLPLIWTVGIFIFPLLNNENTDILTAEQWDYLYSHCWAVRISVFSQLWKYSYFTIDYHSEEKYCICHGRWILFHTFFPLFFHHLKIGTRWHRSWGNMFIFSFFEILIHFYVGLNVLLSFMSQFFELPNPVGFSKVRY